MENNQQKQSSVDPAVGAEDEINLLEYLMVIAKNWRLIAKITAVAFVLSCGAALLLPNIYTATTRVMPPNESKGGLSSMLGGMGDLAALAGISGGGGSGDLYVGMLNSRTVADAIIDRFQLMEVYKQKFRDTMYAKLSSLVNISLGKKDGIISVSVEDEEPKRAAEIANAYVEELKRLNLELNLSSSGRQRLFLEKRLAIVKADLIRAEEAMRAFQKGSNAFKLDNQAAATIAAVAQLRGEIASKEVEIGVSRSFQTEQNPEVKILREALSGLNVQLRRLEQTPDGQRVSGDIFISTSNVADVGLQYVRVMRDLKIQETLFELLTKQYEVAKIEESKDTSTIQVLDAAVVPDKKSKPKRSLIVLAVTFVAGFMAILFSFVREYGGRMSEGDRLLWVEIKKWMKLRRDKGEQGG